MKSVIVKLVRCNKEFSEENGLMNLCHTLDSIKHPYQVFKNGERLSYNCYPSTNKDGEVVVEFSGESFVFEDEKLIC